MYRYVNESTDVQHLILEDDQLKLQQDFKNSAVGLTSLSLPGDPTVDTQRDVYVYVGSVLGQMCSIPERR